MKLFKKMKDGGPENKSADWLQGYDKTKPCKQGDE